MNVLLAIQQNADGQLDELHAERAKLIDRLGEINDDITRLQTAKLAAGASRRERQAEQRTEGIPA